jgi:hypothetical protein
MLVTIRLMRAEIVASVVRRRLALWSACRKGSRFVTSRLKSWDLELTQGCQGGTRSLKMVELSVQFPCPRRDEAPALAFCGEA